MLWFRDPEILGLRHTAMESGTSRHQVPKRQRNLPHIFAITGHDSIPPSVRPSLQPRDSDRDPGCGGELVPRAAILEGHVDVPAKMSSTVRARP